MKPKPSSIEQLLALDQSSLQGAGPRRGSLSEASPARRAMVRLVVLFLALVLGWYFVGEPMLSPLAEAARRHTAESRVKVHREAILTAAREADLEPELVAAIVFAESSGRVDARSSADALGLMQLRMPTAGEQAGKLGLPAPTETDLLTDPELNIRLGAHYFRWVLDHEEGHVERSLVAYNAGRTRLRKWTDEAGGYEEWRAERLEAGKSSTLSYAKKVLDQRDRFRESKLFQPAEISGD
ncbi:MAG: lytic transglycosylase domain-containing protein [Planctomycetes bacterium]|nr:lytic transglycosylase domain-containing protein [Planctomycetota bacterium]